MKHRRCLAPLLGGLAALGCGRGAPPEPARVASGGPSAVASADGRCELRVPEDWMQARKPRDGVVLEVANKRQGSVIVLPRERSDLVKPLSYRAYAKNTVEELRKIAEDGKIVRGPLDLVVGGLPAVRYEVQGWVNRRPIHYLHTTVEGKGAFYQVVGASSDMKSHRKTIEEIVGSFRETK